MNIGEINVRTRQHGIQTLDWNDNKGEGRDRYLVARVAFDPSGPFVQGVEDFRDYHLLAMSAEGIARLFVQIVQSHQRREIDGELFRARNVHVEFGIGRQTFLYIMGEKLPSPQALGG